MRRIYAVDADACITLVNAVAATQDPTTGSNFVAIPDSWKGTTEIGEVPEFDLHAYADGTVTVTNVELYSMIRETGIIADATVTVDNTTEVWTKATHGWLTGDGPVRITAATTQPGGVSSSTDYWIIWVSANTFKIATSFANALAGTAVDVTSNGTGTITLADTADTKLVRWSSRGVLSASVALTIRKSYKVRVTHDPLAYAYAVALTHPGGGNTTAVTAKASPIAER